MKHRLPVLLAPLASLTDIHPEGALPVARAAARFGCSMLLSSVAQQDLEVVARAAGERFVFQLYADGDEQWLLDLAKRAAASRRPALCLPSTCPTFGRRERGMHRRHAMAGRPFGAMRSGEAHRGRAEWPLVEKLKRAVKLPLMLKGIQTAEDAELAVKTASTSFTSRITAGGSSIIAAAAWACPEVIGVARGKAEFIVDGGFLRGTDIVKAVARGAAMVGIGKLQALALGAAGEQGVVRMLELLEAELITTLKLLGVNELRELDGTYLQPAMPVTVPGTLSALPLL